MHELITTNRDSHVRRVRARQSRAPGVEKHEIARPDVPLVDVTPDLKLLRDRARHGGVAATTFRNFPSFPQRYMEAVDMPSADPLVKVERLKRLTQPLLYTEEDLHVRQFTQGGVRRLSRKGQHRAA